MEARSRELAAVSESHSLEVRDKLNKLNAHFLNEKNKLNLPNAVQTFFGMNNTFTWQSKADELRKSAWFDLRMMLIDAQSQKDKIPLIDYALTLPLFTEHRSNYEFTKNTEKTFAERMLLELKTEIENHMKQSQREAIEIKGVDNPLSINTQTARYRPA